jgi:hypothetical protein
LTFRDNPTALSDEMILEATREQILLEQRAWQDIDCIKTPGPNCGISTPRPPQIVQGRVIRREWSPKRAAFTYEWQEQAGRNSELANGALLNVFLRRDADWSFVRREPEWDDQYDQLVEVFVFSRQAIMGRQANFAAQELAPISKQLLTKLIGKVPTRFWFTAPMPFFAYDFTAKAIRFVDPRRSSGNQYGFFDRYDVLVPMTSANLSSPLPPRAATTANYGYYSCVTFTGAQCTSVANVKVDEPPSTKPGITPGSSGVSLTESWRRALRGRAGSTMTGLSFNVIALDKQVEINSIPMDAVRAEALEKIRTRVGGLQARLHIEAQKVEYSATAPVNQRSVLFARLERIDILDPAGSLIVSLTPAQLKAPARAALPTVASAAPTPTTAATTPQTTRIHGEWIFRSAGQLASSPVITLIFKPKGDAFRPPIVVSGSVEGEGQVNGNGAWFHTPGRSGVGNRATLTFDERGVLHMTVDGGGNDLPNGKFEGVRK